MRIVIVQGSPRKKGNTATMAATFAEAARTAGAEVEMYNLDPMRTFTGCISCFACKKKQETCILDDGLSEILHAAREADGLVLASPVYYGEVSGQMKCFIDRTFSFLVPDYGQARNKSRLAPGKRFAMLLPQGHPKEDLFGDIYPRYEYFFNHYVGYNGSSQLVRAAGVYEPGDVAEREDILSACREAGTKMATN